MDFPWYTILEKTDELQQGDFIEGCPILIPPAKIIKDSEPEIDVKLIDSIVLSQSCDLVNDKAELVLVCPYYSLGSFIEKLPDGEQTVSRRKKVMENLRKGHLHSYHLLNKEKTIDALSDYQVVDFRNVYGVHFATLKSMAAEVEKRIRLLPPYREHLSQAFARYFMRVGLPQDIIFEGY